MKEFQPRTDRLLVCWGDWRCIRSIYPEELEEFRKDKVINWIQFSDRLERYTDELSRPLAEPLVIPKGVILKKN